MAKSQATFGKKENEKKALKKRQDKEEKRVERQANAQKGQGLDAMLAYVDENGNITATPPDPRRKPTEINVDDIQVSVRKQADMAPEDPIRKGTVTFYNDSKGYGFIRDSQTQESIFVHANSLQAALAEGDKVRFEVEPGQKGPVAVRVEAAEAAG
ncbi:MAG: cold shock domain-containing protein [Hymenobacteraceae bacterium]|nr:cold shock domain-containing protein [Hymenobacteraceae bacterium]